MNARAPLTDSHGRVMRDLRVSITDRCNFRCLYCLPETEEAARFYRTKFNPEPEETSPRLHREPLWKPRSEILSFDEIERIVRLAVGMGIEKIRITGGEPLLRRGLEELVARLARLEGIRDLAMTTNGFHFGDRAEALRKAGLQRVSFSMDSLDRDNFRRMTGRDGLAEVIAAIDAARRSGFSPIKVNAVVIRGLNDHEIPALARFAHERRLALRFIEFMPLDSGRAWQRDLVVSGKEILSCLQAEFGLVPIASSTNPSETARRWSFADREGEIGIIAPVTQPFCGHCNRLRITADGKIRTCLFSVVEHDLKSWIRGGAGDDELADGLRRVVLGKELGHRIGQADFAQPERTMSCIGG
jgi:cyclic pyranopterin phosphate synthase